MFVHVLGAYFCFGFAFDEAAGDFATVGCLVVASCGVILSVEGVEHVGPGVGDLLPECPGDDVEGVLS